MKKPKKKNLNNEYQNYFIISHESFVDKTINYNLSSDCGGMSALSEELSIDYDKNGEESYKIKIFSYKYNPSKIKEPKTEIILSGYGSASFSGIITFKPDKDNFIYDFSFDIFKEKLQDISPPKSLTLSTNEQFNIFNQLLREKNIQKEDLLSSLLDNSFYYLKDLESYYFDFYLSLLYNSNNKIIEVLSYFNLNKIKLPEKIDIPKYSGFLNKIKISPNIITKNLNDKKEREKYLEIFYSLILYFRINYEINKVNDLFIDNDASSKYYIKIVLANNKHFNNIPPLNNSFVDEIMKNIDNLNQEKLETILKLLKKFEKILIFLNENCESICKMINRKKLKNEEEGEDEEEEEEEEDNDEEINENKKINLIDIIKISIDDNIEKINYEIDRLLDNIKILKYIDIGQKFWENYSQYFNKKNLNALISIKKIILMIKSKTKLIKNDEFIFLYIHETGIDMALKQGFKNNLEMLTFFLKEDNYYISEKYKRARNIEIFNGLKLSEINEENEGFFTLWNSIDFIKIFDQEQNLAIQKLIISNAKDAPSFHILFKLFNYYDQKIFNEDTTLLLRDKYISIIQNYDIIDESIKNKIMIEDSALLIFLLDKINFGTNFVKDDFINKLSISFINKVFLELLNNNNYHDLSDKLIEEISNYFTSNENLKKITNFLNIINNAKNTKCLINILGKIDKLIIKKGMIFNDIISDELILLKEFKKLQVFNNNNYEYTSYIFRTMTVIKEIFDDLKNNHLCVNDLKHFMVFEKEFKERLDIININNYKNIMEINNIINKIINYKSEIESKAIFLDKCIFINKHFFYVSRQREIDELENIYNKITKGNLNEIEKYKNRIEEYENMFTKEYIDDKMLLSFSHFFMAIFNYLKKKNENEEGTQNIFEQTLKEYKSLKQLLKGGNFSTINNELLKVCLKSLENDENRVYSEIYFIQDYFKVTDAENFETIGDNLIIFLKKEKISDIINGILFFLNRINASLTDYSNNLKNILNDLQSKNLNFNLISNSLKYLEKEGLIIINPRKKVRNEFLDIFKEINSKKEAFNYLLELNEEDCRHLHEVVNLSDNTFLNISDIQDMEKCRNFINEFKGNNIPDRKMIKNFLKKTEDNKINIYFKCYFNNFSQIKELREEKFNKNESLKIKLKKVSNYSAFNLSIDDINIEDITKKEGINETYVKFKGYYEQYNEKENKNKYRSLTLEDLLELRDSSMIDKKLGNKNDKELYNYNLKFYGNIKDIINIFNLLNEIAKKGYQDKISIEVIIKKNESNYKIKDNNVKSNELIRYLKDILGQMINTQQNTYKNDKTELMRFIYGRQFNFLNTCLKENKLEYTLYLLDYITNNKYKSELKEFNYKKEDNQDINSNDIDNVIVNCNNYLLEVLRINNLKIKDLYKENIIDKKYSYKGLYYFFSFEIEVEEQILNWYLLLTNNLPIATTLLICNKYTTIDEITSFLYRAFLCKFNALFIMAKIDELQPEKYEVVSKIILKLYSKKEEEMNSCLVFIYSNNESQIVRHLLTIKNCYLLKNENKKRNMKEGAIESERVEIIYSDSTGVGKSTKIKNDIIQNDKKYIYFPLGGEFNKLEVIKRLKQLDFISNKKYNKIALHIDLYYTNQIDLMKEFLFFILITKLYSLNEDIFYLDKEIEVKIELPFGFIDFFSKFPLLKLFKNKILMTIKDLPKIIVLRDINSDIQIMCNYLRLFKNKKIISYDLYIPNISNKKIEEFPTKMEPEIIPNEECEELIYEYLNIEYPNFYQIQNFIKILSGQFKKFSLVNLLSAHILNNLGENFGVSNLNYNRYSIIENIIINSRYFIESTFKNILNIQSTSYNINNIIGEYDENKLNISAIETLSKENEIISYNNIKCPLIFFHEGIQPYFTILSPFLPKNKEYQNLVYLQNIHKILENIPNDERKNEILKKLKGLDLKGINDITTINNDFIKNLISNKIIKNSLNIYEEYMPENFYSELKSILDLKNPINKKDPNPFKLNYSINEIVGYYVITADNFLKMLLILLRIRENIPVIMMGETGCGKTSLIRKLYQLMNDGEDNMKILNIHSGTTNKEINDFLFNKNDNDMSIVEEAFKLDVEEKKKQKDYLKIGQIYNIKKLWVFLDEINTCNSLGLISELMCKHSCNGIPLPQNIVFIGACNPYRLSKIDILDGLHFKNEEPSSNLVYTVNPLPHCLLNFVINFGSLSPQDEKKYIINIIKEPIENYYLQALEKENKEEINSFSFFSFFESLLGLKKQKKIIKRNYDIRDLSENKKKECKNIWDTASKSIIIAQDFVRNINDVSSVSLREIRRFSIFYDYFVKFLFQKKEKDKRIEYKILKDYDIFRYSVILSVYVCYFFHIKTKNKRNEFCSLMNQLFANSFKINFNTLVKKEKEYIIENIKLPQGIAVNEALLNNLFVLFICITSKIPLFIIGKPGCSKSLSVQLLFKSMKGENSDNKFFKSFPRLICNNYQGSLNSSSKGIQKIFDKARNRLKGLNKKEIEKIISMVYFDEMGLAEHSPSNPLKVLHSNLEYDLNDDQNKIAFVGISNWKLDAAKMNRGIILSVPEPDQQDLINTGNTIANSYNEFLTSTHSQLYNNLSITYYKYKNQLKNYSEKKKQDFHGSRDFYHSIKIVAKNLNKYPTGKIDKNELQNIAINSIERNYAGLKFDDKIGETSIEKVKKIYLDDNHRVNPKYDIFEKIEDNINSLNNRYLLLITKSSISEHITKIFLLKNIDINYNEQIQIVNYLKNNKRFKNIIYFVGSKFINDQNSEEYTLKVLNKIQHQLDKNVIIIIKDLEQIYPSLYDLFNQNFTIFGDRNYARISVGYSINTFSLVNDWLKCIIFINEKLIDQQDPPFLNRFEKHIIDFEYLLSEKKIEFSKSILRMIESIKELNFMNKKLSYDISKLLINCHKEEILGLVFYFSKLNWIEEDINDYIMKKISFLLPQDVILLMYYSDKNNKYKNEYKKILNYYENQEHTNLVHFVQVMENNKNIIYTFTNILDSLIFNFYDDDDKYIETVKFGKMTKENIYILLINAIKSENELENIFDNIYSDEKIKLIILKFNSNEIELINYMKCFIEEKENLNNIKKSFIFIIFIKREFFKETETNQNNENNDLNQNISHITEYHQIFIDNLNGIEQNITQLIRQKNNKNILNICFADTNKLLNQYIFKILSYFNYNFKYQLKDIEITNNNYTKYIIEYIKKDNILKNLILDELLSINSTNNDEDIIKTILINNPIKENDIDYISIIIEYFKTKILQYLEQFIFKSENNNFLSPFLSYINIKRINYKERDSILNNRFILLTVKNFIEEIKNGDIADFTKKIGHNKITILLGIQIPGIQNIIYDLIKSSNNNQNLKLFEKYFEKENEIRTEVCKNYDEYISQINKIKDKLQKYEKNFFDCLISIPLFKKIIDILESENNEKGQKDDINKLQEEAKKYLDLFLEDYLLIFLSNNFDLSNSERFSINLIKDYIKIIKKILNYRFNDLDNYISPFELIKKISKYILWIQSNSKYIIKILIIYQKLSFIKLLMNKIENVINKKEIKYECDTNRSAPQTKLVNECFFLLTESMIKTILDENNLLERAIAINGNIYNFIILIKEIYHIAYTLDFELNLFSKELPNLKSFIDIEEIFHENNLDDSNSIKKLIDLLKKNKFNKTNNNLKKEEIEIMFNNVKNLYEFLYDNINSNKKFSKLINSIFIRELIKIENKNYRKMILEIILKNKNILINSIHIFNVIFNNDLDSSVESLKNGDKNLQENNPCYNIINEYLNESSENHKIIEQILLNLFESYFLVYFDSIKDLENDELKEYYKDYYLSKKDKRTNITLTLVNFSLILLKNKLSLLEEIYYKEDNNIQNMNIVKLYCISFIKIYLHKTIDFILNRTEYFNDKEDVMKVIVGDKKNEFRDIMKIYIFKLIYSHLNNYLDLQNFHFKKYKFNFISEFDDELLEKDNKILDYYFLPNDKFLQQYKECLEFFNESFKEKFTGKTENLEKYITENNIDILYSVSVNEILSKIDLEDQIYDKYCFFCKNLFNNKNLSDNFKNVLFLFFNQNNFNSSIRRKILLNEDESLVIINYKLFEILLYGMRFCLQTTYNKNANNLYTQLLDANVFEKISKYCLPGIDEKNDLKINNYYLLENHFKNKTSDYGAYVCSCGTYYEIPPCGFPIESYNCINCHKLIGGQQKKENEKGYHKMIIREGHYRIFKDKADKEKEFKRFNDNDLLIPNMFLSDYKKTQIDPLLKNSNNGIPKIDKFLFIQKDKKIRKLSQIGYRLLNFILYSHLFFNNCINSPEKENNMFLIEKMNYIQILETNWELLKQALFEKGIPVVQIFINLIFEELSALLKSCPKSTNINQRQSFEDSVEKLLEEKYTQYDKYSKIYTDINMKLHNSNIDSLKSTILELYNPDIDENKKYPYLKYFMMTKYPNEDNFIDEFYKIHNFKNKYPLISSYIDPLNDNIKLLKYLPKYNKFVNFMINHYSYKISRNDANRKKLSDEEIYKNNENNFKEILDDFLKIWRKIQKYSTQYKCKTLEEEILHEKMPLSHFLIDDVEKGKGMYLASGYENFIKWQNDFLEPISKSLDFNKNSVLNYFNNNIKNRVNIQEANKNEIISKDFPDNSLYINFCHLINMNCLRNIFFKKEENDYDNTKLNFFNYNNFLYDFDTIEEELGKILLTGKRMFNTDNIKFVTYSFEGFRGKKSSLLVDFTEMYKPIKLNKEEKKQIFDFINEKLKFFKEFDFSQIMSSIQLIIYYLTKEKKEKDISINETIKGAPEYININNECHNFFNQFPKITVEKLHEVFIIFEVLSYDVITKNLKDEYKIDIDKKVKEDIQNYFKNGVQKLIEKNILADACRKLILRYLISNEFNPENLLSEYLEKNEFWDIELLKNEIFYMELEEIKKFNIKIQNTFNLCLILDPENTSLKNIIKKQKPKKKKKKGNDSDSSEEKDSDEDEKVNKKNKPKKKKKKGNDSDSSDEKNSDEEEKVNKKKKPKKKL